MFLNIEVYMKNNTLILSLVFLVLNNIAIADEGSLQEQINAQQNIINDQSKRIDELEILIKNLQKGVSEDKINVIGEKQYDNNAYVTLGSKYTTDKLGESLTSVTPLQIVGPVFINNEIYTFEIELRTIDNRDNWVYDLAGFHYQIIIQDDIILIESTIKE